MSTRVYLIRHGSTELSSEDRFAGAVDVLLSDQGRDQARRLGRRLAGEKIAAAFASPMKRTQETARLVVGAHGLAVTPGDGIREISHGRWEGMRREEVEKQFPEEYARYEHDPFSFSPMGGESGLQVTARALPALLKIVGDHADQPSSSSRPKPPSPSCSALSSVSIRANIAIAWINRRARSTSSTSKMSR